MRHVTRIRTLTRLLVLLGVVACSPGVQAHDTDAALLQIIRLSENQWAFQASAPTAPLAAAARRFDADSGGSTVTTEAAGPAVDEGSQALQQLMVTYIRQGFDVTATSGSEASAPGEASSLSLGAGRVKEDDHATYMVFRINDMPQDVATLTFRFDYLPESRQGNVARLVDLVGSKRRNESLVLDADNDFTASDSGFFAN